MGDRILLKILRFLARPHATPRVWRSTQDTRYWDAQRADGTLAFAFQTEARAKAWATRHPCRKEI